MRFTSFIDCYQYWKLTGYNDKYQVGQNYIGFNIDNSALIIDIYDCTYLYEFKELIKLSLCESKVFIESLNAFKAFSTFAVSRPLDLRLVIFFLYK